MFFNASAGGISWSAPGKPWLDWWLEFVETRHKRPINKDLWEQTEVFAKKTMEDGTLGFWNAEAAWPAAVDEFVEFAKGKMEG